MKITLNSIREQIEVRLEHSDTVTPKEVQRAIGDRGVPLKTRDPNGVWIVSSQFIELVANSLSIFDGEWDARAQERLLHIRQDRLLLEISEGSAVNSRPGLEFSDDLKLELYPEQREAAEFMAAPMVRMFALFWKMGTGKTGALIAAGHELLATGVVKSILVVVERPMAIGDPWLKELELWLPTEKRHSRVIAVKGDKRNRINAYAQEAEWFIMHYGNLQSDQHAIRRWAARNHAVEGPVVIFDESDYVKNADVKRSNAAMVVRRECGRCWISSGNPAPNSPADYEHQISLMAGYPARLGLTGERGGDAMVVVHALEKGVYYLQRENPRKMAEITTPVYVSLSKPQRQEYDRIAWELVSELEDMDDATYSKQFRNVMAKRASLLRLCSDPGHQSLPNPLFDFPSKWRRLDKILQSVLSDPSEKAVIWTRYRATAISLQKRYEPDFGAALMIGGGVGSPSDLDEPSCRLLVATIQIGSSSINLTAARNAIYESLDDVSRSFVQSLARINRTGQTKECRYWFLIAKDTVDEDLFENTIAKSQIAESVLDEIGKPGRAQMIELLKRKLSTTSQKIG